MAESDEDDYLSEKFLTAPSTSSQSLTYADIRKQAKKRADLRNEQNRQKSRRQLEVESREEGLSKSLFERAQEEKETIGVENKAMAMMMKMGYKPGQSLGKVEAETTEVHISEPLANEEDNSKRPQMQPDDEATPGHRKVPIPIDVWVGKKGVGLGKRAPSPSETERLAKAAKLADESSRDAYRTRTRQEYEERRAEGRLHSARKTLLTLDEKAGAPFNILTLNPHDPDTFPQELLSALNEYVSEPLPDASSSTEAQLRQQMRRDALQPLDTDLTDDGEHAPDVKYTKDTFSEEIIEQAKTFLTVSAQERLDRVLAYLRERYLYCFWCGTQYNDAEDLSQNCPGEDEESHD